MGNVSTAVKVGGNTRKSRNVPLLLERLFTGTAVYIRLNKKELAASLTAVRPRGW